MLSPFIKAVLWYVLTIIFIATLIHYFPYGATDNSPLIMPYMISFIMIVFWFLYTVLIFPITNLKNSIAFKYRIKESIFGYNVHYLTIVFGFIPWWISIDYTSFSSKETNFFGVATTSYSSSPTEYKTIAEAKKAIEEHKKKIIENRQKLFKRLKKQKKEVYYVD